MPLTIPRTPIRKHNGEIVAVRRIFLQHQTNNNDFVSSTRLGGGGENRFELQQAAKERKGRGAAKQHHDAGTWLEISHFFFFFPPPPFLAFPFPPFSSAPPCEQDHTGGRQICARTHDWSRTKGNAQYTTSSITALHSLHASTESIKHIAFANNTEHART